MPASNGPLSLRCGSETKTPSRERNNIAATPSAAPRVRQRAPQPDNYDTHLSLICFAAAALQVPIGPAGPTRDPESPSARERALFLRGTRQARRPFANPVLYILAPPSPCLYFYLAFRPSFESLIPFSSSSFPRFRSSLFFPPVSSV